MNDLHLGLLFLFLVILLMLSAFFSGSETGLMAINRYRLRHLARSGHRGARRVSRLLERPDRLIGLILLGNNFFNILAASLATIIAIRLFGEAGIALMPILLTIIMLIFGEVTPKTLAALHPERIAFPASAVLSPLLKIFHPVVAGINAVSNVLLKPLGVSNEDVTSQNLSVAELRTVVLEAGGMIPARHRKMLLSILDLEAITVDDIMVPRSEVEGIDLDEDWNNIMNQLKRAPYTRLVVYRDGIDHVIGFLHMRSVIAHLTRHGEFERDDLERLVEEPYFIPEETPLQTQLLNFQKQQRRIGLVVDEYGDLQGLVTLEDILEEIVGEFTTDPQTNVRRNIQRLPDGSFQVDASLTIRSLNRALGWELPTDGPKTVNGLIMEALETIPEPGATLELAGHTIEIVKIAGNKVKTVIMRPRSK